ncbi:MAG TPA: MgtC/SapB family protein [Polyangiaceae bacterium]
MTLLRFLPTDAVGMAVVLMLAFFIGLEREEHKQREPRYAFGGIRTFPLIGLISYALALMSPAELTPWLLGFAAIAAFMMLSYRHKLASAAPAGLTTELSALSTYVIGGLVQREHYWIATAIGITSVLLLELKIGLEGLAKRFASDEIVTVAKFLVLVAVVLPIVPDRDLTRFHVNPFKTWLVVVAVSGISFASYVLQRALAGRGGVLLSAVLGGAYSSTLTTVVLSRQAKIEQRPNLFAGGILTACAVMYGRLALLLLFFNAALAATLAPAFCGLAALGAAVGWMFSRRNDGSEGASPSSAREVKNPLELGAAFLFAVVFVAVLVLTDLARQHLGHAGLYSLAAILGVTDVDPFILGLAEKGGQLSPLVGARAIVIAAASNNLSKALYAYAFADRVTGRKSLLLLLGLAALGLVPLAWI